MINSEQTLQKLEKINQRKNLDKPKPRKEETGHKVLAELVAGIIFGLFNQTNLINSLIKNIGIFDR